MNTERCACTGMCTCIVYDTIVIGAGIIGSASAYTLQKEGFKTLLIEQFPLPHTRGSSHGASRTIRITYKEPFQAAIMPEAFKMWKELEREADVQLFLKTGLLVYGTPSENSQSEINQYVNSARGYEGIKIWNKETLVKEFPLMRFEDGTVACYEESGGILFADRALAAYQKSFKQRGGQLKDNEQVLKIIPGDVITLVTNKGTHICRKLALCCGAWSTRLLPSINVTIPLKCQAINVCYWKTKDGRTPHTNKNLCAFFQTKNIEGVDVYGMPSIEYPGMMKICCHGGAVCNPDTRDRANKDVEEKILNQLRKYVRRTFPDLEDEPVIMERCMYTITSDDVCVIDTHRAYKNIVFAAGFSGQGFKLAPVVGCMIRDKLHNTKQQFVVTEFEQSRFDVKSKL